MKNRQVRLTNSEIELIKTIRFAIDRINGSGWSIVDCFNTKALKEYQTLRTLGECIIDCMDKMENEQRKIEKLK